MSQFSKYTDAVFSAFQSAEQQKEIVNKKTQLLSSVFNGKFPSTVLVVGFTPFVFCFPESTKVSFVEFSRAAAEFTKNLNPAIVEINQLSEIRSRSFECVLTGDEYFTFANSSDEQIKLISALCNIASVEVVTTLKDYKNLNFKDKEFSIPAIIKSDSENNSIYLEHHNTTSSTTWDTTVYEIVGEKLSVFGPFPRSTMLFKQIAKFSIDAGAKKFLIHKNLMYKSLIRKNYDHIISIKL